MYFPSQEQHTEIGLWGINIKQKLGDGSDKTRSHTEDDAVEVHNNKLETEH